MIWLSSIRAEYLTAIGVDANFWSFVGVQFLILAAAIATTFVYANPEAKEWKAVHKSLGSATVKRDETVDNHTTAAGNFNAIIDRRLADITQAGHHVNADAANVRGQIAAYKRRYVLAQLEPAQGELFREHLTITANEESELLKRLTGVKPFPEFSKVLTQTVMLAQAAALEEISTLRAQIDQIEINKLNPPGVEEVFAYRKAAEAKTAYVAPISRAKAAEETQVKADSERADTTLTPTTTLHPVPAAASGDDSADRAIGAEEPA
jgi:hypothetical protein